MPDRIDYVRILFRGTPDESFAWKDRTNGIMLEWCEPRQKQLRSVCDYNRIYDNAAKQWIEAFDVWGDAADWYFNNIPFSERPNVSRVDYRTEVEYPRVRVATIEHVCRVNKGRTRRTITRIDSPSRTKKGDRDAGGDFFAVGSKGSERRAAFYKRGDEPWAMEVQFGNGYPLRMHQEAVDMYLNVEGLTYHGAYMKVAKHHFDKAIRDMFHFSVGQIDGSEKPPEEQAGLDFQENLLEQFDEYWDNLDDTAREVLREKVLAKPQNPVIIRTEDAEPDDLWSGYNFQE